MGNNRLTSDSNSERFLEGLGTYRWLHDTTTNPFFVLGCIFTGPPGWIFLVAGLLLSNRRIGKLVQAANSCLTTDQEDEALRYLEAALSIDNKHEGALFLKRRCLYVREHGPIAPDQVVIGANTLVASIGIETLGGVFAPVLKKGSAIPCEHKEIFSTASDNQETIGISVFQGDAPEVNMNWKIGVFGIGGVRSAPKGKPQVEVTFKVMTNGKFILQARDVDTSEQLEVIQAK